MRPLKIVVLSFSCLSLSLLLKADIPFPGPLGNDPWLNRPNDPDYPREWHLFSHLPPNHRGQVSDWEEKHGSGLSVDKAWQIHLGNSSTVIAILDSGIIWNSADLAEKFKLNINELPFPEGFDRYDSNLDGKITSSDYEGDSRVIDQNNSGKIDPEDLIVAFSNGVDDDKNGFTDDICGWDFFEMDNNPGDRTEFGHGTGEAKDSVGGLNNKIATAGICGGCQFLPVRLNDSFVVDATAFAAGVDFAITSKASLIQQALGALNDNAVVVKAIEKAYEAGVVIVGSAADETSYHHNFPSTHDPIIYPNSIRHDTPSFEDATTFINFNNCSNYGARVDVTVSGISCSSESTANLSGIIGLAHSYSQQYLKNPLTPGEMIALLKNSADDINRGPNDLDKSRYSSYEGWDRISGYGRANAFSLLQKIKRKEIPPASRIISPHWFDTFSSKQNLSNMQVEFNVESSRAPGLVNTVLEIQHGVENQGPTILLSEQLQPSATHKMVKLDFEQLKALPRNELDTFENRFTYTLRLKLTDSSGRTSETRRTFFFIEDSELATGFPKKIGGSGESSGLFIDLDEDGRQEFVLATGSGEVRFLRFGDDLATARVLFAGVASKYSKDKSSLDDARAPIFAPLASADITGDGHKEIVIATTEGHVIALDWQGKPLNGFPVVLPSLDPTLSSKRQPLAFGVLASPVLADLDKDGFLDIIVVSLDSHIYCFDRFGQSLSGFPLRIEIDGIGAKILSSPAVTDLNNDGIEDLVFGSNHMDENAGFIFAIDGRGKRAPSSIYLPGFPRRIPLIRDRILPTIGTGIPASPVIGDFDGDGELEILINPFIGKSYLLTKTGQIKTSLSMRPSPSTNSDIDFMIPAFASPSLAKIDGHIAPVISGVDRRMLVSMLVGGKRIEFSHIFSAFNPTNGDMLDGFPRKLNDMALASASISVDLDGDGSDEIIAPSSGYDLQIFGKNISTQKFTGGWNLASPAVGDFDGNGLLDLAQTSREGSVFIWLNMASRPNTKATWPSWKGGDRRTGYFKQ